MSVLILTWPWQSSSNSSIKWMQFSKLIPLCRCHFGRSLLLTHVCRKEKTWFNLKSLLLLRPSSSHCFLFINRQYSDRCRAASKQIYALYRWFMVIWLLGSLRWPVDALLVLIRICCVTYGMHQTLSSLPSLKCKYVVPTTTSTAASCTPK